MMCGIGRHVRLGQPGVDGGADCGQPGVWLVDGLDLEQAIADPTDAGSADLRWPDELLKRARCIR